MTRDFQAHLAHQHARLGEFIALLGREQSVLAATPVAIDALSDITENKRTLAAELEQLEAQRQQLVIAHGEAADRAGAQALSERLGCSDLWQDFIARVDEASTLNRLNGLYIGTRLDHTQRTLGFLRQISAQSLYSADGQRAPSSGRRISSGA
ncbi:flagella synthesis protein FlgN [Salinisphaera aquimarina]|uniref:Flagella synthesis protein FlgN n=1 Tax=Salinisphaera aquimarina TaxID=2094031 RepID=A0ABV7ERN9_9GAMM